MTTKAIILIAVTSAVLSCAVYAIWIDSHVDNFLLHRQLRLSKRTPPEVIARTVSPDGRFEALTTCERWSETLSPRHFSIALLPSGLTNEFFRFSFWSLQPPGSNFVWSGPSTLSSTRMPPGIVYVYGGRDLNTQNLDRLSISITVKE